MSSSPAVALCQDVPDHCRGIQIIKPNCLEVFKPPPSKLINPDITSFEEDFTRTKVRKPYTITKQRERWSEEEHNKFLEALKLFGRAWRRIEEHVGTKTAVQIRSHAQKFFSKLERESSTGMLSGKQSDIGIPPPRPKRKPSHPYPKKAVTSIQHTTTAAEESSNISPSGEFQVPTPATLPVNPNIGDDCHKPATLFSSPAKSRPQAVRAALLQDLSPETAQTNGSQKKLKLFGKTVVVPFTQRATAISARKVLSDMGISFKDLSTVKTTRDWSSPSILVSRRDNESKEGFCPYVKATGGKSVPRLGDDAPLAVVNLDLRTSESGGSTGEDTGEPDIGSSSVRKAICRPEVEAKPPLNDTSSRELAKVLQRRGDSPTCELRQESQEEVTKAENDSSKMQPAANHKLTMMSTDIVMSDSTSTSHNSLQVPVANQFHHYPGLVTPPGYSDGILQLNGCQGIGPANLLIPWQVLQAAVFHPPPTYASALPALSWPGMAVGRAASAKEESHSYTGSGFLHGHENGAAAMLAAASTWWTLHGMLPPGFSNQAAANCGNFELPSTVAKIRSNESPVKVVKPAENKEQALEEETRLDGGSTSNDLPELEKKVCCNLTSIHQTPCKLNCFGASEEESVLDEIPFGRNSRADVLEEISFSKTGKVDVAKKQKPPSSNGHDQAAKGRKRSREKSSCASNSPEDPGSCNSEISEHLLQWQHQCAEQFVHTLEQVPIDAQQDIREENFGSSGDIAESGNDSAKLRLKKSQRAGKCQHQDLYSVNGDKGNLKHHRNCVLEAEHRKEVSMEGRKAFQALFFGKSLPQTFISPCDIERMSDYSKITDGIPSETAQSKESVKGIFELQQVAGDSGSSTLQVMEIREEGMRNEKELEVEERECEKNAALNGKTEKIFFKLKCMNESMDIATRLEKLEKCQNVTARKKNGSFTQASLQGFRSTGQAFVPYKQALLEMRAKEK